MYQLKFFENFNTTRDIRYPTSRLIGHFSIQKYGKHWGAEGDQVTVTCEADGNPKPELVIAVDGKNAAQGAEQDASWTMLRTIHTISNIGEQTVTCEIDGTNSKNAGLFQNELGSLVIKGKHNLSARVEPIVEIFNLKSTFETYNSR